MKTKVQKKESIDALEAALPKATITVFTTFARAGEAGLTVAQLQQLKRALRQADGEYVVAKKTLIEKAMNDLKYDGVDVFGMDGSMGLVLGHGDVFAVTKALYQFAKANPSLKLFAAWTDGHSLNREQLVEMATLPSRDELLAKLMAMFQWPVRGLAIVLNEVSKQKTVSST